jgi:twinkle protein
MMTVITGWPSSGKSEWLDALLVNLSKQGWQGAIFSFENQPVALHISKMLEKFSGKPFSDGPTERLTEEEVAKYSEVINKTFAFFSLGDDSITVAEILESAEEFLATCGDKKLIVIDPWNELEDSRPSGMTETEFVSITLGKIRRWARKQKVHVFIVAHPKKVARDVNGKLPIPKPDMISGSQNWWNKVDAAITVWRNFDDPDLNEVEIHIPKVRFKHIGKQGVATLRYNLVTGQYSEIIQAVPQSRGVVGIDF